MTAKVTKKVKRGRSPLGRAKKRKLYNKRFLMVHDKPSPNFQRLKILEFPLCPRSCTFNGRKKRIRKSAKTKEVLRELKKAEYRKLVQAMQRKFDRDEGDLDGFCENQVPKPLDNMKLKDPTFASAVAHNMHFGVQRRSFVKSKVSKLIVSLGTTVFTDKLYMCDALKMIGEDEQCRFMLMERISTLFLVRCLVNVLYDCTFENSSLNSCLSAINSLLLHEKFRKTFCKFGGLQYLRQLFRSKVKEYAPPKKKKKSEEDPLLLLKLIFNTFRLLEERDSFKVLASKGSLQLKKKERQTLQRITTSLCIL